MGAHNEIDVGSLVWVKGEIDQAIERARAVSGAVPAEYRRCFHN